MQMKRPLIVALPEREWKGSTDRALAHQRSEAGSGTKARRLQIVDFAGNASARRGEVRKAI